MNRIAMLILGLALGGACEDAPPEPATTPPEAPGCPPCGPVDASAVADVAGDDEATRAGAEPPEDPEPEPAAAPVEPVELGVDRLLGEEIERIRGKKVGLITNASGVDGELVPTLDRLAQDERFELVQLYAPEHGLRGALPAGQSVGDQVDERTGIPIQSLFGDHHAPTDETLARIDVLIFDIQDIGSRTYTYITTLGRAMEAAADSGVPIIVLDRPNPLGGRTFEGPVRERKYRSFIGWAPIPVSHGMTVGELARFYNTELEIGADLTVIEMRGWRRDMAWQDTGLTWVPTSPNIPHLLNAQLYITTGMIGGATRNVNEGYGTTMPFETIAAQFINAWELADALTDAELPGISFRPITYRPRHGRQRKKLVHGVQLILEDPRVYKPLHTALTIFTTLERLYPGEVRPRSKGSFARIWGNDRVITLIQAGKSVAEIEASWADQLEAFAEKREAALIYR